MATRKIRIFPNTNQKEFFNKCFGVTRCIYNETLSAIKKSYEKSVKRIKRQLKKGCIHRFKKNNKQCCQKLHNKYFCTKHKKNTVSFITLKFQYWRNKIIKKKNEEDREWMTEIPYDTRQLVIKNVLANYKSAISNLRNGHIKSFDLKFKSKKNKNQFFFVDYRASKEDGVLWKTKLKNPLGMRKGERRWFDNYMETHQLKKFKEEKLSKELTRSDMIITREYPSKYYLHIPYYKEIKPIETKSIVSIDPGVRTFHCFYDPNGKCGKIGHNLANRLKYIYEKIDVLQSEITKTNTENNNDGYLRNKRRRQNMRKQCARLRTKIKNIVNDYHWKTISFYCQNYKYIIIPKLNVKSIQKAIKRTFGFKSGSSMIRRMMVLAHNRFVDRLIYKSYEYDNQVFVVDESYTSKTCGKCGQLNHKLGSNKVYICNDCHEIFDRDINGARNILIKILN